ARRAIDDVVVVQRGARGARRDGAAPAVACEDRVAVRRLGLPLATHVLEDLLAALPERRARWTEGVEGAAEQRHDRRGRGERDVGTERLVGRARICHSTGARVASGGGGAGGSPASRRSRAHSTSATSRRSVTSPARTTQTSSAAATGRTVSARSQETAPSR